MKLKQHALQTLDALAITWIDQRTQLPLILDREGASLDRVNGPSLFALVQVARILDQTGAPSHLSIEAKVQIDDGRERGIRITAQWLDVEHTGLDSLTLAQAELLLWLSVLDAKRIDPADWEHHQADALLGAGYIETMELRSGRLLAITTAGREALYAHEKRQEG